MLQQQRDNTSEGPKADSLVVTSDPGSHHATSSVQDQLGSPSAQEVDVPSVRSNEWQEHPSLDTTTAPDGMASFTAPSNDSGYLGRPLGPVRLGLS
jgi:hypothetical protein